MEAGRAVAMDFDHQKPEYRCCCNACHATNGARILFITHIVLAVRGMLGNVVNLAVAARTGNASDPLTNIFFNGIMLLFSIIGLLGIEGKSPGKVLAAAVYFMVLTAIWAVLLVALVLFILFARVDWFVDMVVPETERPWTEEMTTVRQAVGKGAWVVVLALAINIGVMSWYVSIAYGAYKYLRDAAAANAMPDNIDRIPQASGAVLVPPPHQQQAPQQGYPAMGGVPPQQGYPATGGVPPQSDYAPTQSAFTYDPPPQFSDTVKVLQRRRQELNCAP